MKKLVDEAEQPTSERKLVRMVILPSSSSLGGWQIAIIVIGTLLAASFLVSGKYKLLLVNKIFIFFCYPYITNFFFLKKKFFSFDSLPLIST